MAVSLQSPPIARITQFLCIIINPMIIATYSTSLDAMDTSEKLTTTEITDIIHRKVWSIMAKTGFPAKESSDALTIELIHMTGLMIQHCLDLLLLCRSFARISHWVSTRTPQNAASLPSSFNPAQQKSKQPQQ
jgi:hypothetical protein